MFLYDPFILIIALTFINGAFFNEFKNAGDIYKLVVPADCDRIRLY